jgi:hypothetical protein
MSIPTGSKALAEGISRNIAMCFDNTLGAANERRMSGDIPR